MNEISPLIIDDVESGDLSRWLGLLAREIERRANEASGENARDVLHQLALDVAMAQSAASRGA